MSASAAAEAVDRAIERTLAAGADAADALLVESDSLEARVRGDEIDFVKQARERTLGIRALVRGPGGLRSALTSTSDLSGAVVDRMAAETVQLARATAEDPVAGLPAEDYARGDVDLSIFDPADRDVSVETRIADARAAENAARATDARITNSEGSQVGSGFSQVWLGDSRGFRGTYRSASHSLFSEPIAQENGSMQRDYWMTTARSLAASAPPAEVGRKAAERALRRLGGRRVPTCQAPVIFDPVTAPSLLGHVSGCVNGYSIYRQTSFLADRMSEKIASEAITIVDDGRRPGGLGSRPFDGEGQPTGRTTLVERGELKSWLLDSYSARKLDMQTTGNAARSPGGAPSAAPTNLWIEPGEQSLEEIIASTERGLLVTELIGHGFQSITGDYSRGAAGMWIENGELAYPVEEITIAGNLGQMLLDVDTVGSDLLWLGRVAAPSLRVAQMTIAGE